MTRPAAVSLLLLALAAVLAGASTASARPTDSCMGASGGGRAYNVCIGSLPLSEFRVVLKSVNGSAERGVAQISFGLHETRVLIRVAGAPRDVAQAAHLHPGGCGGRRKVVASLGSVRNGRRLAVVESLPLAFRRYSIDVHQSTATGALVVACGTVPNRHS